MGLRNPKKKNSRIEFRITSEIKELIERAALLRGLSLSAYAIAALVEHATKLTDRAERIRVSDQDRDVFLAILDKGPNPALKKSFKKYQAQQDNEH